MAHGMGAEGSVNCYDTAMRCMKMPTREDCSAAIIAAFSFRENPDVVTGRQHSGFHRRRSARTPAAPSQEPGAASAPCPGWRSGKQRL